MHFLILYFLLQKSTDQIKANVNSSNKPNVSDSLDSDSVLKRPVAANNVSCTAAVDKKPRRQSCTDYSNFYGMPTSFANNDNNHFAQEANNGHGQSPNHMPTINENPQQNLNNKNHANTSTDSGIKVQGNSLVKFYCQHTFKKYLKIILCLPN